MLRPRPLRPLVAAAATRAARREGPARLAATSPAHRPSAAPTRPSSTAAGHHPPPPGRAASAVVDAPPLSTLYAYFPSALPAGAPPAGPFAVDAGALRHEFLRLQAAAHPDKQPAARKAAAEAASAAINHAYRTLADPLLRAQYLLSLRGVDVAADKSLRLDPSSAGGGDAELLMLVLEAHEVIEEAETPHQLESLRVENEGRIDHCVDALSRAFAADDIDAAKQEAVRLRYWANIRNAILECEEGKPSVLQH